MEIGVSGRLVVPAMTCLESSGRRCGSGGSTVRVLATRTLRTGAGSRLIWVRLTVIASGVRWPGSTALDSAGAGSARMKVPSCTIEPSPGAGASRMTRR